MLNEQDLQGYAETLILDHATDVEWLSIHEVAEEYFEGEELSDEDASRVADLISQATVIVTWDN